MMLKMLLVLLVPANITTATVVKNTDGEGNGSQLGAAVLDWCPCENRTLCRPLNPQPEPRQEVIAYAAGCASYLLLHII
jgi:hypothetical protein